MKPSLPRFNSAWIAVALLGAAFLYSAARFLVTSHRLNTGEGDSGSQTIRITHWQLEPGFREALDWVIAEYNALPHVESAGIKVVQAPIPQSVYNQFMNVHLISGTASDIAVKGGTELIKGNALAKFYAPLGPYISEPNPYNAPTYQTADLTPELSEFLAEAPWKDTFFDGLYGGYDHTLNDYYGIPICAVGGIRLFYNMDLLREVKAFARKASSADKDPDWLERLWRREDNPEGFLPRERALAWLANDEAPETLGQFFLYGHAVRAYAESIGNNYIVPVAGSNYTPNDLAREYQSGFFSHYWEAIDPLDLTYIDPMEVLASYERGVWSLDAPELQAYFDFLAEAGQFYPTGYLGLDREQAQRRFVLGMAAVIRTGGWDASSILSSVAKRDRSEDRFEVKVTAAPLPAPGERWAEFLTMRTSEANSSGVAPFAINKSSPLFDEALDFLRFATSHRINEEFSRRAGWLPVTVGADPPPAIEAFTPLVEGFPKPLVMEIDSYFSEMPSSIRSAWNQNLRLYATGEITRDSMIAHIRDTLSDPNIGIPTAWQSRLQTALDQSKDSSQAVAIERLKTLRGLPNAGASERATFIRNLKTDEGVHFERLWQVTHPNREFTEY